MGAITRGVLGKSAAAWLIPRGCGCLKPREKSICMHGPMSTKYKRKKRREKSKPLAFFSFSFGEEELGKALETIWSLNQLESK